MKRSELDAVAGLIAVTIAAGAARGAAAAGSVIRAQPRPGLQPQLRLRQWRAAVSGPGLVPTAPAGCGVFNAAGLAPPAVCGAAGSAATGCVGSVSAAGAGFRDRIADLPADCLVTPGGNGGNSAAAGGKGFDLVFGSASPGALWGRGGDLGNQCNGRGSGVTGRENRFGGRCFGLYIVSFRFGFGDVCCGSGGKSSDVVTGGGVEVVADGVSGA